MAQDPSAFEEIRARTRSYLALGLASAATVQLIAVFLDTTIVGARAAILAGYVRDSTRQTFR